MFQLNELLSNITRSRRAVQAVNGLMALLIATSAVQWTRFYMDKRYQALLNNSISTPSTTPAIGFNIDELVTNRIFGAPAASSTSLPQNIPLSSLNLKLTGIIASDRGGFALISVNGQPQAPFFVGEVVTEDAVLDTVLPDRIILSRGGAKESILLDSDQLPDQTPVTNTPKRSSLSELQQSIQALGDNRYLVSKEAVTQGIDNQQLLHQALIVPDPNGGFVVKNISPGSVIEKIGLKPGDVIQKVNDMPVNTMVDVMQLYRLTGDIDKISNINVVIQRQGKEELLQYQLN